MKILRQYTIPFKGLKNGKHDFEFKVDNKFFEAFEESEIKDGDATVTVTMEKSASLLQLHVEINGIVIVECDRCLEDTEFPVNYAGDLKVKFSDETDEYDGDVMWLNPAEDEVGLSQYIYESIILSLPYSRVHGTDPDGRLLCNHDMLERFRIVSQEEFDELTADPETIGNNPEAAKLLELKNKLEQEK